jgi:YebC/PmpR family DNA-binding regulatory protein
MAGHSHSANIKFRKARVDGLRSKAFTKLARMITVAAKLGGGDADSNPRLRLAIDKARVLSMPKDSIERAIKKGTGDLEGQSFEEVLYEGYAPGGVAVLLEALTDNRHRTAPELRQLFERYGGNLGSSGAVAWMFERRAQLTVARADAAAEERVLEVALEAGADDVVRAGDGLEVQGSPASLGKLRAALEKAGCQVTDASIGYVPKTKVALGDEAVARKVVKLLEGLDDHDDVQNSYANYEMSDELASKLAAEP